MPARAIDAEAFRSAMLYAAICDDGVVMQWLIDSEQ